MDGLLPLFGNAVVSGVLLGGFYAAVTAGIAVSFGMLNIVNIAHPAIVLTASFLVYTLNAEYGLEPILAGLLLAPAFYVAGLRLYVFYERCFERRGADMIRGLAFFFGLLFIIEVSLSLIFGVDYRLVEAPYIGRTWHVGEIDLPLRMLVPFAVSIAMLGALLAFLRGTFIGRAVQAVSQDPLALQLMGADPSQVRRITFGLAIATAAIAGALLIIIQTVEPSAGREYIGRVFAITVLGGVGSLTGMLIAAILLGVAESLISTFYGPSWSPAVSFGLLLLTLVLRPSGLLGRA